MRGEDAWYATTWPDMPGGDGLIVRVMQGRAKKISGNPDHPVNLAASRALAMMPLFSSHTILTASVNRCSARAKAAFTTRSLGSAPSN